jgi:predicted small metal-binding protein
MCFLGLPLGRGLCVWYTYSPPGQGAVKPEEESLTKSFQCRDAGVPCRAKVTGETEDEVLQKAVEHAREKHGVDLTESKTLAGYAASLVRDEDESQES